uniref:Lebercilin LCA5 n=2 Tax=Callorhinchus milii TaxID=7868 RepID=A0A4W3ICN6_CALMI|eukprot:gi/632979687/ref/XP_007906609.1/ PREDICTED: lebercilin isoform X2 [Callorhinchus milii]
MDSRNTYSDEDIAVNSENGRSLRSGRSTARTKFLTNGSNSFNDKYKKNILNQDNENAMGDQVRSTGRNLDCDKYSDSYYSDDYDNSSYLSGPCHSPNTRSRTPSPRRRGQVKPNSSSPVRTRANGKPDSRQPANQGGRRWGFRSQSLNKEPVHKEIDLVTKRMLSARLLKINELRNEVSELQVKLEELQKENKILKRLQYRQEKALNKFQDTENEISQLIYRHNNEVRILRERLRKSQEKERTIEKRLKDTEEELHRSKTSLQKLKKLSEDKHLIERDELAQKLAKAEIRMEEGERKIKDLEKNFELSSNSFLRQMTTERKRTLEAQEDIKNLREEVHRLNQKLKEKEKALDVKNIYANRMFKLSPKKDAENTPRKKATVPNTTKGVQTEEYFLPLEFPTPPPAVSEENNLRVKEEFSQKEQYDWDWSDSQRQERELLEREQEHEEKLRKEQDLLTLESKAQKLREKWEQEEQERKHKEEQQKAEQFEKMTEERRKKEILLARMQEIDHETNADSLFSDLHSKNTSYVFSTEILSRYDDSPDITQKTSIFPQSVENVYSGLAPYDTIVHTEGYGRRGIRTTDSNDNLSFGIYAPSFGKGTGRTSLASQKSNIVKGQINDYYDLNVKKDKKSNLMEQLFGSGVHNSATSKDEDLFISPPVNKPNRDNNLFPWEKTDLSTARENNDDPFSDTSVFNTSRNRSKYTSLKPAVKAIDSLEDEVEEVVL